MQIASGPKISVPNMSVHLFLIPFLFLLPTTTSSPLSTSSRWITDSTGARAKLACVNWAAHMETMLAEGLAKQPLHSISAEIAAMGFNCVRLTWALYMVTDDSSVGLTVRQSLAKWGLVESVGGVEVNNPGLLDATVVEAFEAVVSSLSNHGIMVILDNQVSKPGWCCSKYDGNGFFGDEYFDAEEWIRGLSIMATRFNGSKNVVGMSLRNELRGPNQNVSDWYRYMQRGAEAVHLANTNVLVILSGLDYDKDLSFLTHKQVELSFTGKLVYELHWYGFSDGGDWRNGNTNEVCGAATRNFTRKGGFLLDQGWPLFLSEFGVDQSGTNVADNRFLTCLVGVSAELDLDWAIWALQGSYYVRDGMFGYDESYGVLGWDWCKARSSEFLRRIAAIQTPLRGPGFPQNSHHKILFHPLTGLCIQRSPLQQLILGACSDSEAWDYTDNQKLALRSVQLCIQAEGLGQPAKIGTLCNGSDSTWELASDSKMHLSSRLIDSNTAVCLDVDSDGTIVTNLCDCTGVENATCDPTRQWFKIVKRSREIVNRGSLELQNQEKTWKEQ